MAEMYCRNPRCGHLTTDHAQDDDPRTGRTFVECRVIGCTCRGIYPLTDEPPEADLLVSGPYAGLRAWVEKIEELRTLIICHPIDAQRIQYAIGSTLAPGLLEVHETDRVLPGTMIVVDKALAVRDWAVERSPDSADLSDDHA